MPLPNYDREREQLCDLVSDFVWEAYRSWALNGGSEPTLTVTKVLDYCVQHGRFPKRYQVMNRRDQQRAVRSALRTEVNGGRLTSSLGIGERGTETRCYEPQRMAGETWRDAFWPRCRHCKKTFSTLPTDDTCDGCRAVLEPEVA